MHKLQCVMMCVNQKEFKRIHWCSMREIRPRKMIKKDQKFKKLRARKTKRNMKCKQIIAVQYVLQVTLVKGLCRGASRVMYIL